MIRSLRRCLLIALLVLGAAPVRGETAVPAPSENQQRLGEETTRQIA